MNPPPVYLRPEWVLLGVPMSDGTITVFGSLELSEAELRAEINHFARAFDNFKTIASAAHSYEIKATMRTFAMANGNSYGEALSRLFEYWDADAQRDPSRPPIPRLGAPTPALEAPR